MSQKVKAIPDGYHTLTPYICIPNAAKAIEFYKTAFNAKEIERHPTHDGRVMHAVLQIGNSYLMMSDYFPESGCGISDPKTLKGATAMLHIYTENVDAAFDRAVKAGAKVQRPLENTFWGDRYGQLVDPFGFLWSLSMHIADVSPEQVSKGAESCCSPKKTSCCS
jgi:PhnB protein